MTKLKSMQVSAKSIARMLLAMIVLSLSMMIVSPVQTYATGTLGQGNKSSGTNKTTGDINSVGASMKNGKLEFAGDLNQKSADQDSMWSNIMDKYKGFIVGVAGVGTITMIAVFIMNFMKLGTTSANPQERQKVVQALVFSGLAAAGLGSVTTFVALFYYILR